MVRKFVVPISKRNYRTVSKVATFHFPTDEKLKKKVIAADKLKDFVSTKFGFHLLLFYEF